MVTEWLFFCCCCSHSTTKRSLSHKQCFDNHWDRITFDTQCVITLPKTFQSLLNNWPETLIESTLNMQIIIVHISLISLTRKFVWCSRASTAAGQINCSIFQVHKITHQINTSICLNHRTSIMLIFMSWMALRVSNLSITCCCCCSFWNSCDQTS